MEVMHKEGTFFLISCQEGDKKVHSVQLSQSTIEQLLAVKRRIKKEFGEIINLSDDSLVFHLKAYWQKTAVQETKMLLQQCVNNLGEEVTAQVDPVWQPAKRIYRGQVVSG
ncbi:hypothetical protein GV64_07360 [Endozoicomonas elysicola]|uniref:Uncharacterized protein n=1 Tax=Endozoicomonas elysicola TaxID=305900 RepID=A0A081K8V4_9GAMM|nr:hypothetical protein GV64_07360 [Endozoicomonas elysicola]